MKRLLFIMCALLLLVGCGDNSEADGGTVTIADPSQHIQGKWQEIACGDRNNPELTPNGAVIEFLPDGKYHGPYGFHYAEADDEPIYYRMESDTLYLKREGYADYIYRYLFINNNQLLVEYVSGLQLWVNIPDFHIFKRIK